MPQKERIASWESVKKPNIYGLINLLSSIDKKLLKRLFFHHHAQYMDTIKEKLMRGHF